MILPAPVAILHCHSTFALGGKEARAVRLMNAFGANARHVILSAMPDQMGARAAINPSIAVDYPADAPSLVGRPGVRRYRALARYMRRFDLVLTYNWGAMDAVMAHRLAALSGAMPPLIHHEDGFNADESDRLDWRRNRFRRVALRRAAALVVPSRRLERIAAAHWGRDLPIHRIGNGVDVPRYAAPPVAGSIPGFVRSAGDIVVGTIAGLRAVKDLVLLVHALALCPPHVRLVIVGDGPEKGRIAGEIARLGLGDRAMLAGFLPDPWRYVGHFDLLALSSLSEQQPIAVIEAMAAGLPVVAPPVGDIADMVAPANARFIVPRTAAAIADAIAALAASGELRQMVGSANAARAATDHDEAVMIDAYSRLYTSAMGRAPGALWQRATF